MSLLDRLRVHLSGVCDPYIHALDEERPVRRGQIHVLKKLMRAHFLILVETPGVYRSPWVRFELLVCKLKMMPVVRLKLKSGVLL